MFAPMLYYAQPQHIDFAALAEARAAEAVAKAAEAEYLAQQAEAYAHVQAQAPFWSSTTLATRCSGRFSRPCVGCAGHTLGGHGRPQHARQPYHGRGLAELELEALLRRERFARLQLEEEIKRLKAREQNMALHAFGDFTNKGVPNRQSKASTPCADADSNAPFVATHAPQHHDYGLSRSRPAPKPRAVAVKPTPANNPPQNPEDVILNMVLQNIGIDHYRSAVSQQPKSQKVTAPEEAHKQQPKKLAHKGSLIDQLKVRYEREGHDEIRDTIQSVVNALLTPAKHQLPLKQLSPLAHPTNQARSDIPRSPDNINGFDLIEAILGNLNNQSYARQASSNPDPATSRGAPNKAFATATSTNIDTKGKGKEPRAESTSKEIVNALKKVESIERTFDSLKTEFIFPAQLDFATSSRAPRDASDVTAIFPNLAFTSRNHPVRYHEQALSSLLQELDLIESHGDSMLRLKRKMIVNVIENALEELEREVAGRWSASAPKETTEASEAMTRPAKVPKSVRIPNVGGEPSFSDVDLPVIPEDHTPSAEGTIPALGPRSSEAHTPVDESRPEVINAGETTEAVEDGAAPSDNVSSEIIVPSTAIDLEPTSKSQPVVETPAAAAQIESYVTEEPAKLQLAETHIPSSSSPSPETTIEDIPHDTSSDGDSDAFLFSQPRAPEFEEKVLRAKKRREVEVEDLGSDWEDIDEAR